MPLTDGPILEYGDVEGPVQTQEGEKRCCSPSHPKPPGGAALALGQGGSRATVPSPPRCGEVTTDQDARPPDTPLLVALPSLFPFLLPPLPPSSSPSLLLSSFSQAVVRAGGSTKHPQPLLPLRAFLLCPGPPSEEVPPRTAGPRGLPGPWEDLLAPLSSHLWHPRGPRCPPPSPPSRACSQ